jgi:hypothetical protein
MPARQDPDDEYLDRLLAAERFHAFPPALAARILEERLAPAWGLRTRVAGLLGAVALALGAVVARTGALPEAPRGLPSEWVAPPVALAPEALASAAPSWPAGSGAWLAAAALLLLGGGLVVARRVGATAAPPSDGAAAGGAR